MDRARRFAPVASSDANRVIGEAFRVARERKRVSLLNLSREIDCSVNMLRWHEAGARMLRVDLVYAAARALDADLRTLLPDIPDETRQP